MDSWSQHQLGIENTWSKGEKKVLKEKSVEWENKKEKKKDPCANYPLESWNEDNTWPHLNGCSYSVVPWFYYLLIDVLHF